MQTIFKVRITNFVLKKINWEPILIKSKPPFTWDFRQWMVFVFFYHCICRRHDFQNYINNVIRYLVWPSNINKLHESSCALSINRYFINTIYSHAMWGVSTVIVSCRYMRWCVSIKVIKFVNPSEAYDKLVCKHWINFRLWLQFHHLNNISINAGYNSSSKMTAIMELIKAIATMLNQENMICHININA